MRGPSRVGLLSCLLATTLLGCYASDGPAPAPAPATSDLSCAADALALAWAQDEDAWASVYHPVSLTVAPGGALLARGSDFGSQVVRMRDGAAIATIASMPLDAAWARAIEIDRETSIVTVRDVATGELVRAIERSPIDEGWNLHLTAILTDAGDTAIVLQCASHVDEEPRASVRAIELATGAETRVALPGACGSQWTPGASRLHAVEGGAIVIGMRAPGPEIDPSGAWASALGVARVELPAGRATLAFPADPSILAPIDGPFPHVGAPGIGIVGAAIAREELAIVARDGMLRRLDATTLEPIAEPIAVPLLSANWDTYLPSVESPVAYSEGGELLAHVSGATTIAIRWTETGAIVATLELPFAARADGGVPPPMAMRFVGDGLIVTSSHAIARYGCGGEIAAIARPSGELGVTASGPASVRVGERVTFRVEVENATLPVVRVVTMGEGGYPIASLGPDVSASTAAAGTWEVEAIVDDGAREARDTTSIVITE